uniref:uncharacterized protein LOC122601276 n=1 Tax=Erigeron canadensis TaxID=72917 RepID=UPI001CB9BE6A|nr:uncharacterized protein LOC122601276 [Erigeron canadensis]
MSAWVTISTDTFTGNGQQGKDFWRRITEYYNEYRKSFSSRTQSKVKAHWYQLLPISNEFNQIFINVEKKYDSGWSDDQIKERKEPKWSGGSMDDGNAKRTKTTSSGSYTSSSDVQSSDVQTSIDVEDDDEVEFRPIGKKKALGKRKGKATTSNVEVNDSLRDLINQTNSLRMARIDEVNENIKDIKESYKSSKRIERNKDFISKYSRIE